ncbi:MAG: hypothetical protein N3B21_18260 [Clostridia bacterium]|nr:hypothetical protein [Clostridia bacterium]
MKCDFCGHSFETDKCKSGCNGCPMNKACSKIKCPNCNYEMYPEPEFKFINNLKKWGKKICGK